MAASEMEFIASQKHFDFADFAQLATPLTVASKSEAACLYALKKYCDFVPRMGITVQVPLDRYRKADFLLNDCYIEHHPIVLQREFDSGHAQFRFNKTIKKLPRWAKHEVQGILQNEFAVRYYKQRKMLIDNKHKHEDFDLIVTCNAESFYNDVIKRFSKNIPARKTFLDEFDANRSKRNFDNVLKEIGAIKI